MDIVMIVLCAVLSTCEKNLFSFPALGKMGDIFHQKRIFLLNKLA